MYIKGKATPIQDCRVPGGCGYLMYRLLAHEFGKDVSPRHPGNIPGAHLF